MIATAETAVVTDPVAVRNVVFSGSDGHRGASDLSNELTRQTRNDVCEAFDVR